MGKLKKRRNHIRSLPQEIISKILIELPAKSVVRFGCVSKTWSSIIEDPYFIKSHHARSYTRSSGIDLIACKEVPRRITLDASTYDVYYTDRDGKSPLKRFTPPGALSSSFHLTRLQSVHGLICASNYIWNPATSESIVLPSISLTISIDREHFGNKYTPKYFLGFDSTNNTYKVLCILHIHYSKTLDFGVERTGNTQICKILDLGGSSWRDIEFVPSQLVDGYFSTENSCSVDNLICFQLSESILAFDIRCEKFEIIPTPIGSTYPCHLIQVGECISLINYEIETIWLLEDYKKRQWRNESLDILPLLKGMKIKLRYDEYIDGITPLGAIQTGEILFKISCGKVLYFYYYDIDSKIGRMAPKLLSKIKGIQSEPGIKVFLKTHVESLYRLK